MSYEFDILHGDKHESAFQVIIFDEVGKACLEYSGTFAMFFYILKKKSGMKLGT